MEITAQSHWTLFAQNAHTIKKEFFWHNELTKRLASLLYAQAGKAIDCEAIRRCHTLIKQNTGAFSYFQGDMALCVATLLSLSPDPQGVLDATLRVYSLLKAAKLRASDFLAVAAYQIAAQANASEHEQIVTRTRAFYDGMKAQHFFHTGEDDYILSAMLGLSGMDPASGVAQIEQLYERFKGAFSSKNSVQALAQVLVLSGSGDDIESRVLALRGAFRAQRMPLDKAYTLPALGILALLPVDIDTVVREIGEAQAYLRTQKGFGSLSLSKQELLLFAASLTAVKYAQSGQDDVLTAALSTSITNIIIAQQAAMMVAITAGSRAAASASH